jgi:hypothetical protein
VHDCVSVVPWDRFVDRGLPKAVWECADDSWRGRKLATVLSLPDERPVLYADSDILFFPAAAELRELGGRAGTSPRYLRDCKGRRPFLDTRLLRNKREQRKGVNAGLFFHPAGLDWGPALERLEQMPGRPRVFTDQTVVHLAMHQAGARPFDRSRYVLATDDRSLLTDPYLRPDTVLRHYVTPVRHKLWMKLAGSPAPIG